MGGYMGYPDLSKSTVIGISGAKKLAEEHGLDVEHTENGIKLIDPQGNTRTYGANVKAGSVGGFLGYKKGGLVKKTINMNRGGYCGASNPASRPMNKG